MNQNVDVYRNIHKAIRSELFAVTTAAGSLDAADDRGRAALTERVTTLVWLLDSHAAHEDHFFQPLAEAHVPHLAERITTDHAMLDARVAGLGKAAKDIASRADVHELYLELASFASAYLDHQDFEERDLQPALLAAVGPEVMLTTEQALVGSIPPQDMATSMAIMLPAMNVDDRAELLGGMRLGAPPEVFAGVWALAESVLGRADMQALTARLGR